MKNPLSIRILAYLVAIAVSIFFLYPFWWMIMGAFRPAEAVLTNPLALWPESLDFSAFKEIARIGGVSLWVYVINSVVITTLSTIAGVGFTAVGAYAITRRPDLWVFKALRSGFLLTMMYPYMLLVIPVYIVMFKIGLLGTYAGIILFLALGPVQFFLFEQFFRSIPSEVIEASIVDGAGEWQVLRMIVLPMAMPVVATVTIITFLLNWAQWFPVLVISRHPDTYTLPVALLNMTGELGVNFQGIMALSALTTIPVTIVFLIAQKRVMQGMSDGAVKG
ncbi:carbohydrate ABC transporter permease [uncultured Cohaesibacter sp.]|uniref:carbohydrate ABC transporter permease n=1 Tax=uncultured Cohaesibacter sp. TaxID=1002546 RepID=UPI0029C77074|nr:carbohydrate ABC transporter permease [uncultured Cohaesibacter sp.]